MIKHLFYLLLNYFNYTRKMFQLCVKMKKNVRGLDDEISDNA
ncbi:hypothetical protein X845_1183 [Listeria monocytogenes Lm_1824]|nr:hypothetical protein X845_1183 [Listeria monocytogenes Lm_1824]